MRRGYGKINVNIPNIEELAAYTCEVLFQIAKLLFIPRMPDGKIE